MHATAKFPHFSSHPNMALLNSCHSSSTSPLSLHSTRLQSSGIPPFSVFLCNYCSTLSKPHFLLFVQLTHFQNSLCLPYLSSLHPSHINLALLPKSADIPPLSSLKIIKSNNHITFLNTIHQCYIHNPSIVLSHSCIL